MRFFALPALLLIASSTFAADRTIVRSAKSGPWESSETWAGGKTPAPGDTVLIRPGHRVVYATNSDKAYRSIHVGGTLAFDPDKDTVLAVGLLKIQPGENTAEEGFDCDAHLETPKVGEPKPALEVGTPDTPIRKSAVIRLVYFDGMDKESCPAIVCCGGRMDLHGTPMSRTWLKLGADVKKGDSTVTLSEVVIGWRVGDKVIVSGTKDPDERDGRFYTEEAMIKAIEGAKVTLDKALTFDHSGTGDYRGEVANLSRNVVVESADSAARGHTMYHRNSAGSISYAEFRHLGKEGVLGKYAIHFHLVGNTMRGSSVIGASVWDSGNRWVTIHGTNYLVVRDCVGYKSKGHGFFLEDGTEVYNVLDRNLAVQALRAKPLPKQVLPFDHNEGAGFWWANSLNTFTRNVTCENGRYGYRFEATRTSRFDLSLPVMQPDGTRKPTDIRTLPFVRFEDNEAHGDGLYGINLGEGVDRVGPDERHPFVLKNTKIWELHYGFRPQSPCVLVENMKLHNAVYGVYHPNYDRHFYKDVLIEHAAAEPFNRGHDDLSVQYGVLAVDGLTFAGHHYGGRGGMPLIQISDDNPTGIAESHFRNVKVIDNKGAEKRALVNLGGGPRPTPKTPKGVPVYMHDWYGSGQHAKVVSTKAKDLLGDGNDYGEEVGLTGDESRRAKVTNVTFPKVLDPVDDLPPATVVTAVTKAGGKLLIRGVTSDNGTVKRVLVNGIEAKPTRENFAEWEAVIPVSGKVSAHAEDVAGNVERLAHEVTVR
ncbi:MAG TPA: G8 domain-containing protein [Gemmataceae bacterium]|nr:G8 domain-containing protein [Gemmataceae bacterium]